MARVKMPIMGVDASGQLGKSMVFGNWRGVRYARTHVYPTNPNTEAQQAIRGAFAYLNDLYKRFPADVTSVWVAYAKGRPLTDRNGFLKYNTAAMQDATDITNLVVSPGVAGGYALSGLSLSVNASANSITATATAPDIPSGWSISRVVFVCVCDQDPHGPAVENPRVSSDASSPYTVTFENLRDGQRYLVAAFAVYTKPDGSTAYGPSINALSTEV